MPKQLPPKITFPYEELTAELKRLGDESVKVLGLAGDLLAHVRAHADTVSREEVPLVREARRDTEHARILCEGLARRWNVPLKGGAQKGESK